MDLVAALSAAATTVAAASAAATMVVAASEEVFAVDLAASAVDLEVDSVVAPLEDKEAPSPSTMGVTTAAASGVASVA